MMTIHYHGTPLTPRGELYKMSGKNFCVSFANPFDIDVCMSIGQSVMMDNGAFTLYTKGKEVNWNKFYEWVDHRIGPPHWAIVPDVIGGDISQNMQLIHEWPHRKDCSAVVWHMDEPIDHLLNICSMGFGKVCFGSSGKYWQVGSPSWERRCDEAFNALSLRGEIPWIHMLRGLAMCGDRWPFASADSVNVARNYKDNNSCPERMARRIDSIQCPLKWISREKQGELL